MFTNQANATRSLSKTERAPTVLHTTDAKHDSTSHPMGHPTVQAYAPLIVAHRYFNADLFSGVLPDCIITLQRGADRVLGYFHGNRFGHREQQGLTTDEIAMNPRHFRTRPIEETLSTLVHEMTHQWQFHFGKHKSRVGWHNKEWSAEMQRIGLRPTHDGTPTGRLWGQNMTHIIEHDGLFARSCQRLMSKAFCIAWFDRLTEMTSMEGSDASLGSKVSSVAGKRTKFTCSRCQSNAWGKPSLKLICGDCNQTMRA